MDQPNGQDDLPVSDEIAVGNQHPVENDEVATPSPKGIHDQILSTSSTTDDNNQKHFHIFISYRVKTDAALAEKLCDKLKNESLEKGLRFSVFLDKQQLIAGRQYEHQFEQALKQSCLILPIISEGSLEMLKEAKEGAMDNVLLEWNAAIDLAADDNITIIPILVGQNLPDGSHKRFSTFNTSLYPEIQTTGTSRTVRSIISELFKIQGLFLDPEDVTDKLRSLVARFESDIWPLYRHRWHDVKSIAPEPLRQCVQCLQSFRDSENVEGACGYHLFCRAANSATPSICRVQFKFVESSVTCASKKTLSSATFGEKRLPNPPSQCYPQFTTLASTTPLIKGPNPLRIPKYRKPEFFNECIKTRGCPLEVKIKSQYIEMSRGDMDRFRVKAVVSNPSNKNLCVTECLGYWRYRCNVDGGEEEPKWEEVGQVTTVSVEGQESGKDAFDVRGGSAVGVEAVVSIPKNGGYWNDRSWLARKGSLLIEVCFLCIDGSSTSGIFEHVMELSNLYFKPRRLDNPNSITWMCIDDHTSWSRNVIEPQLGSADAKDDSHVAVDRRDVVFRPGFWSLKCTVGDLRVAVLKCEEALKDPNGDSELKNGRVVVLKSGDPERVWIKVTVFVDFGCRRVYACQVHAGFQNEVEVVSLFLVPEYGDAVAGKEALEGVEVLTGNPTETDVADLRFAEYRKFEEPEFFEQPLAPFTRRVIQPEIDALSPTVTKSLSDVGDIRRLSDAKTDPDVDITAPMYNAMENVIGQLFEHKLERMFQERMDGFLKSVGGIVESAVAKSAKVPAPVVASHVGGDNFKEILKSVNELKDRVDGLESKISSSNLESKQSSDNLSIAVNKFTEHTQKSTSLDESTSASIAGIKDKLDTLIETVCKLGSNVTTETRADTTDSSECVELDSRVSRLMEKLEEIESSVTKIPALIKSNGDAVTINTSTMNDIQQRIASMESTLQDFTIPAVPPKGISNNSTQEVPTSTITKLESLETKLDTLPGLFKAAITTALDSHAEVLEALIKMSVESKLGGYNGSQSQTHPHPHPPTPGIPGANGSSATAGIEMKRRGSSTLAGAFGSIAAAVSAVAGTGGRRGSENHLALNEEDEDDNGGGKNVRHWR
ncbi:hypothetical protein HDU76_001959 [Blyttiomyces sp. JEL0837]|nr:hypothetical protein HDU76_001959 [Blyttiomyces sp. JEL0837]